MPVRPRSKPAAKSAAAKTARTKTAVVKRPAAPPPPGLESLVVRLTAASETLARAAAELPKASDFQPLADHLYGFAQTAPAIMESLRELSEGLAATQSSFEGALLRMPHPDEYEPLAAPLRDFARISPKMVEVLEELRARLALGASATMEADPPPPSVPAISIVTRRRLEEALGDLDTARKTVRRAVSTLPDEEAYAPVAAQLRELASVSPSLLDWLQETPRLAAPLAASVRELLESTVLLETAHAQIREAVRELWPDPADEA